MEQVRFAVTPMGKPRMTRRDKWAERDVVMRYRAYKDELKYQARETKYTLGDTLGITFFLPMPESWSQVKRVEMLGKPHQQKPDIDNLVKGFMDAFLVEDSGVWNLKAQKLWAINGAIDIFPLLSEQG